MRRLRWGLGLLAVVVTVAWGATTLPRTGLSRPQRGDLNWDTAIQGWLDKLDTYGAFSDLTLTYSAAQTFPAGTFLDKGNHVYNVKSYGATGDGTTDDTTTLQAAIDAACGGDIVFFPDGVYKFSTLSIVDSAGCSREGITLMGTSSVPDSDVGATLKTTTTNATAITVSTGRVTMIRLGITTSGTPTSGQILVNLTSSPSYGNLYMQDVWLDNYYEGLRMERGGRLQNVRFAHQISSARSLYLLNTVDTTIEGCSFTVQANASSAIIDVESTSGQVDTLHFSNISVARGASTDAPALYIHGATRPPRWIQIVNATFENGAFSGVTTPAVKIDHGTDIHINNSYIVGGLDALQINGGTGISVVSTLIAGAWRYGVYHGANAPTELLGNIITDNSQAGSGTYDGVYLDSASRYLRIMGGMIGNDLITTSVLNSYQNYAINAHASAANYATYNVLYKGNLSATPVNGIAQVDYNRPDGAGVSFRIANGTSTSFQNTFLFTNSAGSTNLAQIDTVYGLRAIPPAAETIAAGATITANACGGIKAITSSGVVTTNTTNTFTASVSGCVMDVCNTGANNITLDQNALFTTAGGVDLTLGADDCVRVGSDGSKWRQISAVLAGS